MSRNDYTYVDTIEALEELATALDSASWHALDTESNSGFAYAERLCLLQLNVADRLWLVDLVALEGPSPMELLRGVLESPEVTTCLHGGEFDVGCFKRDYDLSLRGVWDSQQAASFLGFERTGYAAVVEAVSGVALAKAFTQHDWARRPLAEGVLDYAVDDVRYLPAVWEELTERVAAADLEEEVAIQNLAVEGSIWDGGFKPAGFWKVKGVGNLPETALPLMAELWRWRDEVARERDTAPGRTLNNRTMLAISRRPPRSRRDLRRLGLPGRLMAQGTELLELAERVRRSPPEVPKRPRRPQESHLPGKVVRHREDRLKQWRTAEANRRGVPLQAVLPTRALDHLKKHGPEELDSVPQLGPKRIRMYGKRLIELLE